MSPKSVERRLDDQELGGFFEDAAVGLHAVGPDGIILRVNRAELTMLGYSREEYVGHNIAEFHVDRHVLDDILQRLTQGETLHEVPARMRAKDGSIRDVLISSNALFEDGKFIHTRCLTLDVTEFRQEALRQSESRLASEAAALARLNEATARLWTLQDLHEGLEEMLSATIELFAADKGNVQILDPERKVLVIAAQRGFEREFLEYFREVSPEDGSACGRALRSGQRIVIEDVEADLAYAPFVQIARNAGYRGVQSTPLIGRNGAPLGMLSTHFRSVHRPSELDLRRLDLYARQAADFIERCRTEQALRESEHRFTRFMEHLPGLAWIKDPQGRYVFANEAAVRAFRTEPSRLYGRTDEEIFPAATAAAFRENDQRAHASATGIQTIETLEHADGIHHSLVSKFRIPGLNGEGTLVGGMAIDVTERIRAEVALRESEQRYRAVLESQAEMVCRFHVDGTILFANSAYARARGVALEVLIGSNFWGFVAEEDRKEVQNMIEGLSTEAPEVRIENRFQTVDGERWTLWTNRALTFDSQGRVVEAQSTGIDITERKQAEEALRLSNEALRRANADLEQFAYSASHDLQEPIRNISLSSEILATQYGHMLSGKAVNYLSFITAGAKRMEKLVRDLLMYTQSTSSQEPIAEDVDVTLALGKALGNLSAAINESHAQVFFDKLPSVRVREIQLQQLFQNLISNGIKYRRENESPRIEVKAERQGAEWLFSVRDNGIGIQPEYTERVFGIFKRLHPEAKYTGTGIGLAICQRIVERNGGRIWVESAGLGKGSTFYFTLPAGS